MTERTDFRHLKHKSLWGIVALLQQTFVIQLVSAIAILVQLAYLSPVDFGILGIANSIISFLTYFTDVGLAGALIQKKDELTPDDLETTFTIQQILAVIVMVVGFFLTSTFASLYHLNQQGVLLFQVLLISFFISSFKTIPAILLERKLNFQKLVIPQIIEALVYNILLTILAIKGFGIASIMWASLARSIAGLVAVFMLSPWKITLGIKKSVTKELFRFGLPYQANSFIAMAKDDILFLFLGRILPLSLMGIISIAKKLSDMPIRMVMDSVTRITFPAFSRMQHDMQALRKALEYTMFGIASLVFPIYISAIFLIHPFMIVFPRYLKWEPSLVSFYLLCGAAIIASFSTPLVNAMSAIGKIRITMLFMIMWLILTWAFVVPLVSLIGFNGFALALFLISATVILVVRMMQHFIPFSFIKNVKIPFLGGIVLALWYALIIPRFSITLVSLMIVGSIGAMLYAGIVWTFERNHIVAIINGFRKPS